MQEKFSKPFLKRISFLFIVLLIVAIFPPIKTQAASLTTLSDTMSRDKVNTLSNHDISFVTPTGVSAAQTITIAFQSDFSIPAALDYTDVDVLDNGSDITLGASALGATWGITNNSSTSFTITSAAGTITAGHTVRIKIGTNATTGATGTHQITNPTTIGTKTITISGSMTDSGTISVQMITNDQVVVTATVSQAMSFSLGSNTVSLGTLSTGSATTGTHTLAISTNASSGMAVTVAGVTLTSGSNTITACASGCASSVGTSQFGINLVSNATPSVGSNVSGSSPIAAAASGYGTADSFRFVTGETIATASNPINTSTFTVSYLANIAGTTVPGSYTTTLTYIATANF